MRNKESDVSGQPLSWKNSARLDVLDTKWGFVKEKLIANEATLDIILKKIDGLDGKYLSKETAKIYIGLITAGGSVVVSIATYLVVTFISKLWA